MSLKDLFKQGKSKVLVAKSIEEIGTEAESERYVYERSEERKRTIPHIDFSNPKNFAKFGSAEEYYAQSISRIYNTYPYDGSRYEKQAWENSSSYLDLYILEELYPRTNGYAIFSPDSSGNGWGNKSATIGAYDKSSDLEYIFLKGGPNPNHDDTSVQKAFPNIETRRSGNVGANLLDLSVNRESNLKFDGAEGNTVEFWLKKSQFLSDINAGGYEVVFDSYTTSSVSSSVNYARLRVELTGNTSASPFRVTFMSGTNGLHRETIGDVTTSSVGDNNWHHYAFVLKNTGSLGPVSSNKPPVSQNNRKDIQIDFYVDGTYNATVVTGSSIGYVSGGMVATVGALAASPSGAAGGTIEANIPTFSSTSDMQKMRGYGKLSGSLDEVRFWKEGRTARQIGLNWKSALGAGTNLDEANTQLGVYYKFNEGITQTASVDSNVLDYAGRVTNGDWVGYEAAARSTNSAIVESSASAEEFKDPIVYSFHPDVKSLKESKELEGRVYDFENPGGFYRTFPDWMLAEDSETEEGLLKLTQIMSSYFDTLYLQLKQLPSLKDVQYVSSSIGATGSYKPLPFSERVLESKGFLTSEIFADATILEQFLDKDDHKLFTEKLSDVKNLIYQNVHNNLVNIYKTKGTENAFRNFIRCFGVDDEVIQLNAYANNQVFELKDNYRYRSERKNYIDFNTYGDSDAVVYQFKSGSNSSGFISASQALFYEHGTAQTFECEVITPKPTDPRVKNAAFYNSLNSSVFGVQQVNYSANGTVNEADTSFELVAADDYANFQVFLERENIGSTTAKFVLTGSNASGFTSLTSSLYREMYDNRKWNLAVRVVPNGHPFVNTVSGSTDNKGYKVEFYGVNYDANTIRDSFYLTASLATKTGDSAPLDTRGDNFLKNGKRMYVGALRTNFTGTLVSGSDLKVSSTRAWMDYITNDEVNAHAIDASNIGTLHPYRSAYLFENSSSAPPISKAYQGNNPYVPAMKTLALNWDFKTLTGSSPAGTFSVVDFASGSAEDFGNYRWLGNIVNMQHPGQGKYFRASESNVVDTNYVNSAKQQEPESITGLDMINSLSRDDVQFTRESRPISYYFMLEKSMYKAITEQMLNFFATVKDFNDLIGSPVNRYRQEYKSMEKIRQLFFERVDNTPDLDKYIEYYRWLDSSIGEMAEQLYPASADHAQGLKTIVESHVLERNKYRHQLPSVEQARNYDRLLTEEDQRLLHIQQMQDAASGEYGTQLQPQTASPLNINKSFNWWSLKADRTNTAEITSGDATVDKNREQIRRVIANGETLALGAAFYRRGTKQSLNDEYNSPSIKGAPVVKVTTAIAGGSNSSRESSNQLIKPGVVIEAGSITYLRSDQVPDTDDITANSTRFPKIKVQPKINAFDESEAESRQVKTRGGLPSVYSGSAGLVFSNVHQYVAHGTEQPMQSPFVKKYVGGYGDRSVPISSGSQNENSRLERFRISATASQLDLDNWTQATATLTFDASNFNSVNNGTVALTDAAGTTKTYKIRNDYGASAATEFNAAANRNACGTNFAGVVVSANGHAGTIFVLDSAGTRFSAGGTDFSDGVMVFKQATLGDTGNTTITTAASFDNTTSTNIGSAFAGGSGVDISIYEPRKNLSGTEDLNLPRTDISKGTRRVYNTKNLLQTTASADQKTTVLGNYDANYQVVQTSGRSENNLWFSKNSGSVTSTTPEISFLNSNLDYELPTRTVHKSVFVERFSSPGGFEASSLGYLDPQAAEKSVYNALPFRNLSVLNGSGSIVQAATATLTFDASNFNSVNNGTVQLIDAGGISKTYKIKNDASANAASQEFNSGANRGAAAENLAQIVEGSSGHGGTIFAADSSGIRFSTGGYNFSDGVVAFTQKFTGPTGNTTVTTAASFDNTTSTNIGSAFAGGSDGSTVPAENDTNGAHLNIYNNIHPGLGDGYNELSRRHAGQFGIDSVYGTLDADGYETTASYQKQHRNVKRMIKYADAAFDVHGDDSYHTSRYLTASVYNNLFYNAAVPQSELQYAWISASLSSPATHPLIGHTSVQKGYDGQVSGANGYEDAINFTDGQFPQYSGLQSDLAGMNTLVLNVLTTGSNLLTTDTEYRNTELATVTDGEQFHALMKHRNSRQGASWRLNMKSDHPLVRNQRSNNIIDVVEIKNAAKTNRDDVSSFDKNQSLKKVIKTVKKFTVPPVTSKFKPLTHVLNDQGDEILSIKDTYSNNFDFMTSPELDSRLGVKQEQKQIHDVIVNDASEDGVIVERLDYKETVYPREENAYLGKVRGRITFTEGSGSTDFNRILGEQATFWRDNPHDRRRQDNTALNSQGMLLDQFAGSSSANPNTIYPAGDYNQSQFFAPGFSCWPLDAHYLSNSHGEGLKNYWYDPDVATGGGDATIQANEPPQGNIAKAPQGELLTLNIGELIYSISTSAFPEGAPAFYGWRGPATASQNFIYPNTFSYYSASVIADPESSAVSAVKSGTSRLLTYNFYRADKDSGNRPFHDSYEEYSSDIRALAKNSTVVPEFRVSEHIDHYIDNNFGFNNRFLTLQGANSDISASAETATSVYKEDFFKVYSHSDFMQQFAKFDKDDNDITKIKLSCHGVKKLLPYNGFYPALRAVQLGSLFSSSYAPYISGSNFAQTGSNEAERLSTLLQSFFAPGIMYNTIKSGIAVDFPVVTGSAAFSAIDGYVNPGFKASGNNTVNQAVYNYRMPFEALVEPDRYLPVRAPGSTTNSFGDEGTVSFLYPFASMFTKTPFFTWSGERKLNYNLAMSNFLSEVPNFFLSNQNFKSFTSKPEKQFKTMKSGSTYYMDISLAKTDNLIMAQGLEGVQFNEVTSSTDSRLRLRNMHGQIFGPASAWMNQYGAWQHPDLADPATLYQTKVNQTDPAYAPHTPPYYYADSIARIAFTPHDHTELIEGESKFFTLDEIIAGCKIETVYTSSVTPHSETLFAAAHSGSYQGQTAAIHQLRGPAGLAQMRLSSSLNLFGKSSIKTVTYDVESQDIEGFVANSAQDPQDSSNDIWTISPKFECPVVNVSSSTTLGEDYSSLKEASFAYGYQAVFSDFGSGSSGFGNTSAVKSVWGQYGTIPTGSEGVFMNIKESFPEILLNTISGSSSDATGSLIDICGFEQSQKRIGEIASTKEISEAVVAIPFIQRRGKRKFFKLLKSQIDFALGRATKQQTTSLEKSGKTPGSSILNMVESLKKYVLPPHMDFMKNKKVDPYVAYVFEFTHTLDQDDLSNIWQNLMPKISQKAEEQEVSVSHGLGKNEFFAGKELPAETQWMVFKIKRRADYNYFAKTADSSDDSRFAFQFEAGGEKKTPDYSYNWPYDFFSLVELASIDAEIEFTKKENS